MYKSDTSLSKRNDRVTQVACPTKDLTKKFFQHLGKYNNGNQTATTYFRQKQSQFERSVLSQITQNEFKLREIGSNQSRIK